MCFVRAARQFPQYVWDFCSDHVNRSAVDTYADKCQGKPFVNLAAREDHGICRSRACAMCLEGHHNACNYFTIGINQASKQLLPYLEEYNYVSKRGWTYKEISAAHMDLFEQETHEVRDENNNVIEVHYNYFVIKVHS